MKRFWYTFHANSGNTVKGSLLYDNGEHLQDQIDDVLQGMREVGVLYDTMTNIVVGEVMQGWKIDTLQQIKTASGLQKIR